MKNKGKYHIPPNEAETEIFPNKLNVKTKTEIEQAELEGFIYASKILFNELTSDTKFDLKYIFRIHQLALSHLYEFAGKARTVNMSKGGFVFPSAKFLDKTLKELETTLLLQLPSEYQSEDAQIVDIAKVHAELLFIHPFREGNGRTARLLANLMAAKAGHKLLELERFSKEKWEEYIMAVQQAAVRDYSLMEKIIRSLF